MNLRSKIQTIVSHNLPDSFINELFCDGISEITQRIIALDPAKAEHFMFTVVESYDYDSDFANSLPKDYISELKIIGDVVSVSRRETNINSPSGFINKSADKIPLDDYYIAQDETSLKFRSEHNPGYIITTNSNLTINDFHQEDGAFGEDTKILKVVPVPGINSLTTVTVKQIVYNITNDLRTSVSEDIVNPLDHSGVFKYVTTNGVMLYKFPEKYQHLLFTYVISHVINAVLLNKANVEEDQELVLTLKEAKQSYQNQYDQFFQFLAPQQRGQRNEG
tara:strand:+ start:10671 stop:11504 length:834 start_codon:yes stop_codon:yes gene_type:complete